MKDCTNVYWKYIIQSCSSITLLHYIDVIMTTITSQITILAVVYSTVYSDADQRKHQSSASLAFVWGIHRDRWIPRTKGQLRGKCFHLMTSSCYWNLFGFEPLPDPMLKNRQLRPLKTHFNEICFKINLPDPMLENCQSRPLETHFNDIWIKINSNVFIQENTWQCRLQNVGHFCLIPMC